MRTHRHGRSISFCRPSGGADAGQRRGSPAWQMCPVCSQCALACEFEEVLITTSARRRDDGTQHKRRLLRDVFVELE